MCGIAALVDYADCEVAAHIADMSNLVRHRGPDDEGYTLLSGPALAAATFGGPDTPQQVWRAGLPYTPRIAFAPARARVALGHRRLSILDLSAAGHQPMRSGDGRYWIVYNGEIYNHVELRIELQRAGHHFTSLSDTEVILAAWQHWGKGCLERFNGMFAFVLVDRRAGQLIAARDRFGVKPLYWWHSPNGYIAFASEIKQFSALPGWDARLNAQMGYDYLAWGLFDHTAATLFAGVQQLRGGELIELALAAPPPRVETTRWYTLCPRPYTRAPAEAAMTFLEAFTDAVRLRLRADVPVGSCLSGGLDSSSIVCVANRLLREQGASDAHKTFSAASHEARFDERSYAQAVIDSTGVDGCFVYPDAEGALGELERVTWHQDEPFGSSSIYAQWCVFRLAAANHVKVMLDGQGADEQLAGYPGFLGPLLASMLRSLSPVALTRELVACGDHPSFGYKYALGQLANVLLPAPLRMWLRARSGRTSTRPAWLDIERLGAIDREPFGDDVEARRSVVGLSRRLLLDTGVPMLLHTEDRNSMAHSVESRVPFLDYRLVELVLGMPDRCKLSGGVSKQVLREAMRGILPESVRTRRDKLGFATAEETWAKRSAMPLFRRGVEECIGRSGGIVHQTALAEFDAMVAGHRPFSFSTWRVMNFGVWLRRFDVRTA